MSDIYANRIIIEPISVSCPECGRPPGNTCADPPYHWNHGTRIWIANSIMILIYLKQPEPEYTTQAPKDSYVEGWNDAIDAIVDKLSK